MHGDYTRSVYHPHKRFSAVRMQQGRVWLDGDWNEQIELDDHRRSTLVGDVVGCCGAPAGDPGFTLSLAPVPSGGAPDFLISPGRAYAGGVLCELPAEPAVNVKGVSATVVRLAERVLASRALAVGQWVQVDPGGTTTTVARVLSVADTDPGAPGPVDVTVDRSVGLAAGATGRLRRVPSYRTQPDLPARALTALETGTSYIAYLEVRERHLTALEDAELREVALGGPDTTTRIQTVGQVKLLALEAGTPVPDCDELGSCWSPPSKGPVGRLAARAEPDPAAEGPCAVPEEAGFRGLGNQSYLVQVRDGSDATGGPTFVFSRDHGAVTHAVASIGPNGAVALSTPPLDRYRTLVTNDWVELVDDDHTLAGVNGPLVRVGPVDDTGTAFTTDPPLPELSADDAARTHAYLRRWDQKSDTVPLTTGDWILLELGVQVRFEVGGTYQPGEFWTIPARTALGDEGGDVLWPRDGHIPRFEEPHGPRREFCALAVLTATGTTWEVERCLPRFVPLAGTVTFDVVGGDGQEAGPGMELAAPLEVRVSRGGLPRVGAAVTFSVIGGGGAVLGSQPTATTGPDGVASARWRLGAAGRQAVTARLLDTDGDDVPGALAHFFATAVVPASTGGGCEHTVGESGEFPTLKEAIIALGARGERQVCLCLSQGEHRVEIDLIEGVKFGFRSLSISGCGPFSRLTVRQPLTMRSFARLALSDLAFVLDGVVPRGNAALSLEHCQEVHLTRCWVSAAVEPPSPQQEPSGTALRIGPAEQVRIRDCTVEAFTPQLLDGDRVPPVAVLSGTVLSQVFELQFGQPFLFTGPVFAEVALSVANAFASDPNLRDQAVQRIVDFTNQIGPQRLTPLERTAYGRFVMRAPQLTDPEALLQLIESIRRASVRAEGAVTLVFELEPQFDVPQRPRLLGNADGDEHVVVEGCDVLGTLSLTGPTTNDPLDDNARIKLDQLASDSNIVDGYLGTLRLQGNQLGRITVGLAMWQQLTAVSIDNRFGSTPTRCLLLDNIVASAEHLIVARRLLVSGNVFSLGAVVPGQIPPLGFGLAHTASYIGNHADLRVEWRSAASAEQAVANLQLQIV